MGWDGLRLPVNLSLDLGPMVNCIALDRVTGDNLAGEGLWDQAGLVWHVSRLHRIETWCLGPSLGSSRRGQAKGAARIQLGADLTLRRPVWSVGRGAS